MRSRSASSRNYVSYACSMAAAFRQLTSGRGVSEEASLDQQTVKICLEEIKRCRKVTPRPNFIVLLGDRYGWRPLPYEIPASEFEEIERHITDVEEKDCSIPGTNGMTMPYPLFTACSEGPESLGHCERSEAISSTS